jgi:enoyl-CoA hydratase/carnithine racemase
MTPTSTILITRQEGIFVVTLNRPDRMNAFTVDMRDELIAALDEADADDSVRAVIFTGAGDRAFCAGADLSAGGGQLRLCESVG